MRASAPGNLCTPHRENEVCVVHHLVFVPWPADTQFGKFSCTRRGNPSYAVSYLAMPPFLKPMQTSLFRHSLHLRATSRPSKLMRTFRSQECDSQYASRIVTFSITTSRPIRRVARHGWRALAVMDVRQHCSKCYVFTTTFTLGKVSSNSCFLAQHGVYMRYCPLLGSDAKSTLTLGLGDIVSRFDSFASANDPNAISIFCQVKSSLRESL